MGGGDAAGDGAGDSGGGDISGDCGGLLHVADPEMLLTADVHSTVAALHHRDVVHCAPSTTVRDVGSQHCDEVLIMEYPEVVGEFALQHVRSSSCSISRLRPVRRRIPLVGEADIAVMPSAAAVDIDDD